MLLDHFPLPSVSFIKKLSKGGVDTEKALRSLFEQHLISKDCVLLIDEMYLQKEVQYDKTR